jgi:hypothetical protein
MQRELWVALGTLLRELGESPWFALAPGRWARILPDNKVGFSGKL